jgi:hypothetical protein
VSCRLVGGGRRRLAHRTRTTWCVPRGDSTLWSATSRRGTLASTERTVDDADTPNDVAQVLLASYANDVRVVALDSHPLAAMARLVADAWRP